MHPLSTNILVEEEQVEQKILLPTKWKRGRVWGKILEVGDIDEDMNVGDRIFYSKSKAYVETKNNKPTGQQLIALKNIFIWGNMKVPKDRILVKQDKPEVKTASGLILPTEDKPIGEVVSIGKDVTECSVGDRVYYQGGTKITVEGEEYLTMREDAILMYL